MKISTRQYLRDLRKAEEKGYQKGKSEAFEEYRRDYGDSQKDERFYDLVKRVQALEDGGVATCELKEGNVFDTEEGE